MKKKLNHSSINHIHLDKCDSTQSYIKEINDNHHYLLVSCEQQTAGYGRGSNQWTHFPNSLAVSFSILPNEVLSLTSIEVGVIISQFLNEEFNENIKLKWPNDLYNQNQEKIGGIIIQNSDQLFVGVGINFGLIDNQNINSSYSIGSINQKINKKEISLKLYQYIINNRIENIELLKSNWNRLCIHMNKSVILSEGSDKYCGKFIGIGNNGEAIILVNDEEKSFFTGNLLIN